MYYIFSFGSNENYTRKKPLLYCENKFSNFVPVHDIVLLFLYQIYNPLDKI